MRAARRARGFTLTELMVGILLSGLVVAALYNMFVTASYVFYTQEQVSATQLNLRYAMSQVRDDLRRAGAMATPNSEVDDKICPKPARPIHGIILDDGAGVDQIVHRSTNPDVRPDRLLLAGNFTSSGSYPAIVPAGPQAQLRLPTWEPRPEKYRPRIYYPEVFTRAFQAGHYLRITNAYGKSQIVEVTSANANQRSITLAAPPRVATDGECGISGSGDSMEVNPVSFLEYQVERRNPDDDKDRRTDLVRWFVDANRQHIPDTDVVVAEYIVDFQVWFMARTAVGEIPPDGDLEDHEGNAPLSLANGKAGARPDWIRTALVKICARAEREDENWVHRRRASPTAPLRSFDVDGVEDNGAARVICLSSEMEIVNMTVTSQPTG